MSRGIDYGNGLVNLDKATGIRYGVISQHDVLQAWADSSEPNYGEPNCPKCGNDCVSVEDEACPDLDNKWLDKAVGEEAEYYCAGCEYLFGSESAFGDEPLGYTYNEDGYLCECGESGDIFIMKSPYYTRAQFCSPCAPGACHLGNPTEEGEKAYCFDKSWFDGGVAPYPVYNVADDTLVSAERNGDGQQN